MLRPRGAASEIWVRALVTRAGCGTANAVVVSTTGCAMRGVGGEDELWSERESMERAELF